VLQQALEALRRTPPQVPITDPEYLAAVPDWLRDEPPSSWGLHQGAIAAVEKQLKELDSLSVAAVNDATSGPDVVF
jgi:hypothetical protein